MKADFSSIISHYCDYNQAAIFHFNDINKFTWFSLMK